jgi:hypothetical protein
VFLGDACIPSITTSLSRGLFQLKTCATTPGSAILVRKRGGGCVLRPSASSNTLECAHGAELPPLSLSAVGASALLRRGSLLRLAATRPCRLSPRHCPSGEQQCKSPHHLGGT